MVTRGSFAVELGLWLLFCAPGVIYSLWRLTSKRKCCPSCNSEAIVRADSPRGRQMVDLV
jgi:hypothetical protein